MKPTYDLVFAGAGISTTFTLIHLLEAQEKNTFLQLKPVPIRVAVIEKSGNVFTGMPYGNYSTATALIITPINDFLPEEEKLKFIAWLELHKIRLIEGIKREIENSQSLLRHVAKEWINESEAKIHNSNWNDFCIPRHWFGEYITERVKTIITKAETANRIKLEVYKAEVISTDKNDKGRFLLTLIDELGKKYQLESKLLVLAIGSPPQKKLLPPSKENHHCQFIEDVYFQGFIPSIEKVLKHLQKEKNSERRNVLIVGTNASALEVIYHLRLHTDVVEKIYLLSTDASLPQLIGEVSPGLEISSLNLDQVENSKSLNAQSLFTALEKDAILAKLEGHNITDINSQLTKKMAALLYSMQLEEQYAFFKHYGMKTTKIMRRAGNEYRLPLEKLLAEKRLELLAGRFHSLETDSSGSSIVFYSEKDGSLKSVPSEHINSIINCTGSELLNEITSELINSLFEARLASPTVNLLGLKVNEEYEASENLFVMGPLLAGNINSAINSWHVESAWRIAVLSKKLAVILELKLDKSNLIKPEISKDQD